MLLTDEEKDLLCAANILTDRGVDLFKLLQVTDPNESPNRLDLHVATIEIIEQIVSLRRHTKVQDLSTVRRGK